ncbi:TOBE domain-containing protein [Jhaorihella thermophila]
MFVRPEAIRVARDAAELARFDNRIEGTVTSLLFNGAASRILVRHATGGGEIEVALPQSGEFADLGEGDRDRGRLVGRAGQLFPGDRPGRRPRCGAVRCVREPVLVSSCC